MMRKTCSWGLSPCTHIGELEVRRPPPVASAGGCSLDSPTSSRASGVCHHWTTGESDRRQLLERRRSLVDQDELRRRAIAWVERSCREQGAPVKLSNPELIDRVAQILEEGRRSRRRRRQA